MKASTRARYGIRAMVDIAINAQQCPLVLKDIAKRQQLSVKYMEHIIKKLKTTGYLASKRGIKGGYCLGRPAEEITLGELFEVLEGGCAPVACACRPESCSHSDNCAIVEVWQNVHKAIYDTLNGVTLAQLATKQGNKPLSGRCN